MSRIPSDRLPKTVYYGEFENRKRFDCGLDTVTTLKHFDKEMFKHVQLGMTFSETAGLILQKSASAA